MKFLKKIIFGNQNEDDFYTKFDARANCFCIEKAIKKKLEDYLLILFAKNDKRDWRYNLIVGTGKVHSWTFEIDPNWKVVCRPDDFKKTMDFEIEITNNLSLILEFPAHGNLEVIAEFRLILSRLIFQSTYQRNFTEAAEEEIEDIIKLSQAEPEKLQISEQTISILNKVQKRESCEFAVIGQLYELDATAQTVSGQIKTISQESVLSVDSFPGFKFEMQIIDDSFKLLFSAQINKSLDYLFDYKSGLFLWTMKDYINSSKTKCLSFRINSDNLRIMENLFLQFFIESQNQTSFDQFLKNDKQDWHQFYSKKKSDLSEVEDSQISNYKNNDYYLNFNFNQDIVDVMPVLNKKISENQMILQTKENGKMICFRDHSFDVFNFSPDQEIFSFENSHKIVKDGKVSPTKIILNENKGTFFLNDRNRPDSLLYSDMEKQKIVSLFTPKKDTEILDFSVVGGKNSFTNHNPMSFAIGSNDIYKIDPRDSKGIVEVKSYSSKIGFNQIVSAPNESFAIASTDGTIRLYKDLSSNAKNVIPAYLNDKVISLDSSKDGSLLLANCGKYLMLFLTKDQENSGYSVTFKKEKKPAPRILRVHPAAISEMQLDQLNFTGAKFDEHRVAYEQFIIAWNEKAYAVWSITKVMRNEFSTDIVRKFGDKVVYADFKYDNAGIITAFPNKLGYQKTKIK